MAADAVKVVVRWCPADSGGWASPAALCAEAALSWQGLGAGTVSGREKDTGVWF